MSNQLVRAFVNYFLTFLSTTVEEKNLPKTAMDHCLIIIPKIIKPMPKKKNQLGSRAISLLTKKLAISIDTNIPA